MSNGITDNQVVTTSDLNNIAIDLGATSFNGFTTNKFGASELNKITNALVSKGILLNNNQCAPKKQNDKIYIQTGTIVFESGAKKTISEPVEINIIKSNYIYAYNNDVSCNIICADSLPESGDYVQLAKTDSNGNVIDCREFARCKALSDTIKSSLTLTETIWFYGTGYTSSQKEAYTFEGGSGFSYILWTRKYSNGGSEQCYAELKDNSTVYVNYSSDYGLNITKNGDSVSIVGKYVGHSGRTKDTFTLTFA